jgi:ankyrin repeat protein
MADELEQDVRGRALLAMLAGNETRLRDVLIQRNNDGNEQKITTACMNDLNSFLQYAVGGYAKNAPRIITRLIELGANPNEMAPHHRRTPLESALSAHDDASVIAALIQGGADINKAGADGATPLHWCGRKNRIRAARVLLEHGASIDIRDRLGRTVVEMVQESRGTQSDLTLMLLAVQENDALQKENEFTPIRNTVPKRDDNSEFASIVQVPNKTGGYNETDRKPSMRRRAL